ncbi:hypothetical protein GCM10027345_02910 [Hymenobacter daeguensis]
MRTGPACGQQHQHDAQGEMCFHENCLKIGLAKGLKTKVRKLVHNQAWAGDVVAGSGGNGCRERDLNKIE